MAKKQELNLGGLMMGVTSRLSGAMEEAETIPSVDTTPLNQEPVTTDHQTQIEADNQATDTDIKNIQQAQPDPPTQDAGATTPPAAPTDRKPIEEAIDDDINMYAGITKPVSFALPKDIKRALDNFVDDYNDARPTNKTTQAKAVAQALRNFLTTYQ